MAATTRLVVAGGSGFLGSRICKSAVTRGWDVVSLSRHGEPAWDTVSSSANPPRWAKSVNWVKADVMDPTTYLPHLKNATAVVYSLGIILEADYKGIVQGNESLFGGIQKLFCSSKSLENGKQKNPPHLSYAVMNRDLALTLAKHSSNENVPTFVYISAEAGGPILPSGYITSKRQAESLISTDFPNMRNIYVRPTFMYDSSRKMTMPIALGGIVGSEVNNLLGGRLSFMGIMTAKPLKVGTVGEAVVEAIGDGVTKGVMNPRKIEDLATKGWRRTML
ncbi:ubiquinone biosynthesis protein COQ11 [Coccidioides immitis RS]|uniref:NAD-dependent epimerase/dehydratase domain-containing protein n=4 Tax=Coccidioides immitis TaxID=5501 RepID=J3KLD7_COCIM|nr:ubiquinone biosynthesis protein COQ11 [Coccidioides immitis RS]KMP10020.1 NAD dependent epimerase/dehydratase family protein [Coccidioides immitis RMSCC 2394]KMU81088.1 hypothetical protein CISG_02465 [Coccidioides immitis RMSCC 3703]KMU86531.1 NAD dependent epimerase/dehydratase family protein [Coccidioides immitis H538.4]TPX24899.1 hypothetical protein DIZ76_010343 [Coccidioides immitis]EAS37082.3 hypothetical protein CIMG_02436 [Coccidioides immitis RS]